MEVISKLEARIAVWHSKLPHLPLAWRTWLADNCWWLIIIYVVVVGLGLLALLQVALLGGLVLTFAFGAYGAAIAGLLFIIMLAWLGLSVLSIVLMVLAVRPLRKRQKRGWTLLFIVLLVSVFVMVVRVLWNGQVVGLVPGLLGAAVSGYLLFEIRDYFGEVAALKSIKGQAVHSPEFKASTDKRA